MNRSRRVEVVAAWVLALCAFAGPGPALATDCPDTQAMFAELDSLKRWGDLHRSFKKFQGRGCDDGAFAEGYSDFVVRTLAHQWKTFGEMRSLVDSDVEFKKFVLGHIDATTDQEDIKRIRANADRKCPRDASALCAAIGHAAQDAEKMFGKP